MLDLCGKYLLVALLLYASLASGYWFIALIAAFLFISVILGQATAKVAYELRGEDGFGTGELTVEKVARIREQIRAISPAIDSERNAKNLPSVVQGIWEGACRTYAPPGLSVVAVAVYLVLIALLGYTYYWAVLGG